MNTKFHNKQLFGSTFLQTASTRKQKAKEKRSRQSDVMFDMENMDIVFGTYSRYHSDEELEGNVEIDSRSNEPRQDMFRNCEELLNTENTSENGVALDTTRLISTEISQPVTRKSDELKRDSNTQITESINSAIHGTILPSLQNSLSSQNRRFGTNVDSRSSKLSRNTRDRKHQNACENTQNPTSINSNHHPRSRDSSLISLDYRDDHDSRPDLD